MINTSVIILSLFVLAQSALTTPKTKGPMQPLTNELLQNSIPLTDECKNISIVEWKSHSKESLNTKISVDNIDKVCNKSVKNFFVFSNQKKSKLLPIKISLLPASSDYRNLNDSEFRFVFRSGNYDNQGNLIPIFGYFQRSISHIYLINEVLKKEKENWIINPTFKNVFIHEIFHALSYQTGLFHKHVGDKDLKDEKLAVKFANLIK